MALVKCKECGEEVSTKAKACTKCGAKAPKKTSLFTWLVLIIIIFVVYTSSQTPTSNKTNLSSVSDTSVGPTKTEKTKKIIPPKPAWNTSNSKDEMTGKLSAYASSPISEPNKAMSFPYSDVNAWIAVGCDGESKWSYIGFNGAPNLADTQTEDGYNLIKTRMKWDENIEDITLTQKWGAKYLHFQNDSSVITKLTSAGEALLELQWHGQQSVYFKFTLNGSSKALSKINKKCSVE
jgi:hypothetical protein